MKQFFKSTKSITLKEIITLTNATCNSSENPAFLGVGSLHNANNHDITFFNNKAYKDLIANTKAGACFITEKYATSVPQGTLALIVDDPYIAFALVSQHLYPMPAFSSNIAKNAVVANSAKLGKNVAIGNFSTIGENVTIGDNVFIGNNVNIGNDVVLGSNGYIFAGVSIKYAHIGNEFIIHDGVCIGQDGFGFAPSPAGPIKIPQIGGVIIEDDVEIGSNTCVDRGALENTVIGASTKIDNLVQIAHNVRLGKCCFLASGVAIGGSAVIEDFVMIGGQASLAPHIRIVSYSQIAPLSGVAHSIDVADTVIGVPAINFTKFWRLQALFKKMLQK